MLRFPFCRSRSGSSCVPECGVVPSSRTGPNRPISHLPHRHPSRFFPSLRTSHSRQSARWILRTTRQSENYTGIAICIGWLWQTAEHNQCAPSRFPSELRNPGMQVCHACIDCVLLHDPDPRWDPPLSLLSPALVISLTASSFPALPHWSNQHPTGPSWCVDCVQGEMAQ
jgi:hypothetical protein